MIDKTELARRKLFAKLAHEIIAVWPGYAAPRPSATNRTDQCMQCELAHSLDGLVTAWIDVRVGKTTEEEFNNALTRWWADRMHAVNIFGIKETK